jgi:hypothetical protein
MIVTSVLLCFSAAHAAILNFKWDANDPKEQVKEYRLYQDVVKVVTVLSPLLIASIPNVIPGEYSFYLTAANEWGGESTWQYYHDVTYGFGTKRCEHNDII